MPEGDEDFPPNRLSKKDGGEDDFLSAALLVGTGPVLAGTVLVGTGVLILGVAAVIAPLWHMVSGVKIIHPQSYRASPSTLF